MYIGNDLQVAESGNKIIDDISSGFNGSTTSFALLVGGAAPVPFPINTQQIYLSVNGVIQEPDPTGSAGFKLLGNNIVFSSAPANGHAFFGVILSGADYVTVGTEFPAGSATAPSITFGNDNNTGLYSVTGGTMGFTSDGVQTFTLDGDGFKLPDNKKLLVGSSSDLAIYHDGSHSHIHQDGTGDLQIRSDNSIEFNTNGGENAIWCDTNGAVKLYYDGGGPKLQTTSGGIDVTGTVTDDGATHDGDVTFTGAAANVVWDKSVDDLIFYDNAKAAFGTSSDLTIYHDGSHSYVDNATGNLYLEAQHTISIRPKDGENGVKILHDGSVELYYDNSKKAETVNAGFQISGVCTATSFAGDGSALTGTGVTSDAQRNTVGGTNAGDSFTGTDAIDNTLLGYDAGTAITSGDYNVAFGSYALDANTTGYSNVAVGYQALTTATTANRAIAIGDQAMELTTTGSWGVAIGWSALEAQTDANYNVAIGFAAGKATTTGGNNVFVGAESGEANTTGSSNTVVGMRALEANTTGYSNVAFGANALKANTTGVQNTALGFSCLTANTTANNNVGVGYAALTANTTGTLNCAVGLNPLLSNTTGNNNVAVGYAALALNTTANNNTAVGYQALYANTTGEHNVAVGSNALDAATTADNNTAVGHNSQGATTTGTGNDSFGAHALRANTTGNYNVALGAVSMYTNTTGLKNIAIGYEALVNNTTAGYNCAIGFEALKINTTGASNVAIGHHAGYKNNTGSGNVGVGEQANYWVATTAYNTAVGFKANKDSYGASNTAIGAFANYTSGNGDYNVAVGKDALYASTSATNNTAVGTLAMKSLTTGGQNVALGAEASEVATTGSNNVSLGFRAMHVLTTGSGNHAMGGYALQSLTTGSANIGIGYNTGGSITTSSHNTCVGGEAATGITTGHSNVCIGYASGTSITTGYNNNMIGDSCTGQVDGQASTYIGANLNGGNTNNFMKLYQGNIIASYGPSDSGWSFSSDGRDKTDVVDLELGLEFIKKLNPRKFRWNFRDTSRFPVDSKDNPDILITSGFIAQEIKTVLDELSLTYTGIVNTTDPENLTVSKEAIIPMLVNAVKELSVKVAALEAA